MPRLYPTTQTGDPITTHSGGGRLYQQPSLEPQGGSILTDNPITRFVEKAAQKNITGLSASAAESRETGELFRKSKLGTITPEERSRLDELHKKTFDLALAFSPAGIAEGAVGGLKSAFPQIAEAVNKPGVISRTAQKIAAPFKKSFQPEVAEAFSKAGIVPPVSAVSKSPTLRYTESLSAKGLFGRKIVENIDSTIESIKTKTDDILTKIKPLVSGQEQLGMRIQKTVKDFETGFRSTQNKVYDEFLKDSKNIPAITDDTQITLDNIIQQQNKSLTGSKNKIFQKIRDKISIPRKLAGSGTIAIPNKNLTFDNLKATRTSIGAELGKNPRDPFLNQLYKALTKDMDATVIQSSETLGPKLTEMTQNYKNGITQIQSGLTQSIVRSNPENLGKTLSKRNSVEAFKQIKKIIGEENFGELSQSILAKIFESSNTRGTFDIAKFQKNLSKYDDGVLSEVFNPAQLKSIRSSARQLEALKGLENALKPATKVREGSQTAFLARSELQATGAGAFLTALLTGNIQLAATILVAGVGNVAGQYATSKLFTTPVGRKFITEGFDLGPAIEQLKSQIPKVEKGARLFRSASLQRDSDSP